MTKEELQALINQGEGLHIEFKESVNSKLGRELSAFANSKGGKILLGVNDAGNIVRNHLDNKMRSEIQTIARSCDPAINIELESVEGEDNVLVIHVSEGEEKPYRFKEGFYAREGASSNKRTTKEIYQMFKAAGRFSFDDEICEEADFEKYFEPSTLKHFMVRVGKEQLLPDKETLYNLGVLKNINGKAVFTNAGVLFFTKEPTFFHIQALIQCVVYKGNVKIDIENQKDMKADVITNIEESIAFLRRALNVAFKIDSSSLQRQEVWEIPQVALREAIVNAIAHKDYTERGTYIRIEVFDDRVSISNYGGLGEGFEIGDLGKKTFHRNTNLVDLLQRSQYIERLGTGILRINRALEAVGLPKPEFEADKNWFSIVFKRKKADVKEVFDTKKIILSKRDKSILEFCKEPKSRVEILEGLLKIKNASVNYNNNVKHLVENGLLTLTNPDSINAPNQKYFLSEKGVVLLSK